VESQNVPGSSTNFETDDGSFIRWQAYRIGQLSLCISLFLTFSVATLGFAINLLIQPQFCITNCYAKVFFALSGLSGLSSITCGSFSCLTRLKDFRATANVARHRNDPTKEAAVTTWRDAYGSLGERTYQLFYWQLTLCALQIWLLAISLTITFWARLI
jgi:hypothetical protein